MQIFTLDPAESKLEGSIATIQVPYEPLAPGPVGSVFEVNNFDGHQHNRRVDLDDRHILISSGLHPNASDPRFHQQMVYAVASSVYATFRTALGRHIVWGFAETPGRPRERLVLRPYAFEGNNAFYDGETGEIRFGYYKASREPSGRNLPNGWIFTCLSHDIIVHELTHALLEGLRASLTLPTSLDVLAFHEALADLVAVLQHFSYEKVVETAIRKCRGDLSASTILTGIGSQFRHTTQADGRPLRSAIDERRADGSPVRYTDAKDRYQLGSVLVSAVFEAFTTIFKRKTERYLLLATNGSGILPPGDLSPHLVSMLAREASKLAGQFLSIVIRAIDYCPPVDITFGDYLRALITADYTLVPDDPWSYREALIDAFRLRGIYPEGVDNLSEEALLWRSPLCKIPPCPGLSFSKLQFQGGPSIPAGPSELRRQANELGQMLSDARVCDELGLIQSGSPRLEGDAVDLPCIHSIRSARRVGPQGQIVFDLIAEITQRRTSLTEDGRRRFKFHGGSTVVIDPEGRVRYVVSKNIAHQDRLRRQRDFLKTPEARLLWQSAGKMLVPRAKLFSLLHK